MQSFARKFAAIGLAILMMVMLALPAAAAPATFLSATELDSEYYTTLESADGANLTDDPKLTIRKFVRLDNDSTQPDTSKPIAGVEFKYAKVGNLYEIKVSDTEYVMAYGITQAFGTAIGLAEENADYKDGANWYFKDYNDIKDKLVGQTKDTEDLKNFLVDDSGNDRTANGVKTGTTGDGTSSSAAGAFTATLDDTNPWGLYLVVEYDVSNAKVKNNDQVWEPVSITQIQAPFIVALPTLGTDNYWDEEVTADVKNSTDTADVEKGIVVDDTYTDYDEYVAAVSAGNEIVNDTDTTSIGDTVHFRLKGTVLDIPANSNQSIAKYVLTDIISKGLTPVLDGGTVKIDAVRVTGGAGSITLGADDYTVSAPDGYTASALVGETGDPDKDFTGGQYFTVTFTGDGLKKLTTLAKDSTNPNTEKAVYFYYSATVNADAVIGPKADSAATDNSGNPNKVKLNYQVSDSAEMATRWDKVTEFTFGINVTKQFENEATGNPDASAVAFKLYTSANNGTTKTYYSFSGSDGAYHTPTVANGVDAATELKLDSNKQISIKGLDELPTDTFYYLEEISTAPGYNLLKEPVKVEISADKDQNNFVLDTDNAASSEYMGTINKTKATASATGVFSLTVINTQGFTLPSTGGAGIWMFVIGGIVIIAAGCAYFLLSRKKNR